MLSRNRDVTATSAAAELGGSTGLYSFHLRQLARHGLIEELPGSRGRTRRWCLTQRGAQTGAADEATPARETRPVVPAREETGTSGDARPGGMNEVARGLEDESYRRWRETRSTAPARWRHDEAFSQAIYLTPDELAGMAKVIKALIGQYRHREAHPDARPEEAAPVAVVARLFPLLGPDEPASR